MLIYQLGIVKRLGAKFVGFFNDVLNGSTAHWLVENLSLQIAYVELVVTRIYKDAEEGYDDPDSTPEFVLPTAHFKAILEAWRDYLMK